jgi:non-ribosomal peptide synthetase component F
MLQLPLARANGAGVSYAGGRVEAEFPRHTVEALKALAAEEATTLFSVLLAAFCALLHSHTGQEDLVIATAVAGRQQPSSRTVIGYFNDTLPLRLSLAGDPTIRHLIRSASAQTREMAAHQELPFHTIVALPELAGRRITQCLVTLQNILGLDLTLPGVISGYRDVPNGTTNFDLALFAEEKEGALRILLDYKTGVFE